MIVLVSGGTKAWFARHPEYLGRLMIPGGWNNPEPGQLWAMDNGAFTGFDESAFLGLLERLEPFRQDCIWVAVPDVVADAAATLERFREWAPRIIDLGYPVAFVLQDGVDGYGMPPWDHFDAVFIGGTTEFKMGLHAARLARMAKAEGKWVHMGRVNSIRRMVYANSIGCDSIDGTSFSRWADVYVPRAARILPHRQLAFEGEDA